MSLRHVVYIQVITAPSSACSAIQLEAYKKYILLSLIIKGKVLHPLLSLIWDISHPCNCFTSPSTCLQTSRETIWRTCPISKESRYPSRNPPNSGSHIYWRQEYRFDISSVRTNGDEQNCCFERDLCRHLARGYSSQSMWTHWRHSFARRHRSNGELNPSYGLAPFVRFSKCRLMKAHWMLPFPIRHL